MAFRTVVLFRAAPMLALAALAACGTPQEQCINQNTRDLRVLDRLIAESKGNLARGYAIVRVETTETEWIRCEPSFIETLPDGTTRRHPGRLCLDDVTHVESRPAAIDLGAEKAKLASMEKKRAELAKAAAPLIAACKRAYPEG
jgi:hypothetical protein